MTMTIQFEPIQEQHVPEVLAIYNYYVLNTTVSFHTEPLSLEQMRAQLMNVPAHYKSYIIRSGEASADIAGYILVTPHKNKQAYDTTAEVTVYLHPDQTGQGLGSQALCFLEEAAAESGFHVLVATVCTENINSIRLFERHGYEKCAHFRQIGRKFDRWLDIASYQKIMKE
ncbi:GNAT family N-acetyltransferase [Paenibacillus bovis]|uniref:Acetyltransferase n=1 Tax=Paenibacillus bovis TaxID=1616788 RepID=A0A172ZHN9_9BACL|nr:GNAT family N-acetyltransferase [Paenibacillus bovis]ANF96807.1 acetyltransferase [Paenibacillus bovis]